MTAFRTDSSKVLARSCCLNRIGRNDCVCIRMSAEITRINVIASRVIKLTVVLVVKRQLTSIRLKIDVSRSEIIVLLMACWVALSVSVWPVMLFMG